MTLRGQRGIAGLTLIAGVFITAILLVVFLRTQVKKGDGEGGADSEVSALDKARGVACRANRATVERDIQMWLVGHPGDKPTIAALEADNIRIASCPEGGTYAIEGVAVVCDKHE